jgi:FHA domain/Domain of unknown function (DUF1707)
MASSLASPLGRLRPSAAERERVALALRRACLDERLSVETFATRLDLVYAARTRADLDRVLNDLPEPTFLGRIVLHAIAWTSRWSTQIGVAWRVPRTPRMILPLRDAVVIGRSPQADFVVADETVSARHALLTYANGDWALEDAGSLNGTYVNGWRVVEPILVRPGDELTIGSSRFILVPPTI